MSASVPGRGARIRRPIAVAAFALTLLAAAAVVQLVAPFFHRDESTVELRHLLAHRGRVVVVGRAPELGAIDGLELVRGSERNPVGRSLREDDVGAALEAMRTDGATALLVEVAAARRASSGSVLAKLGRYRLVDGFRVLFLSPDYVLAEPFAEPSLSAAERDALARVARQILAGAQPPRLSQFPPGLRAPYPAEVLLLLRRPTGELALWRSARSSSLASGLLTAVGVARQRWEARTAALGGSLGDELPRVTVEVALLVDDGTLGSRARGFIDQAIDTEHGVAYDDPSMWRYLLPEAEERRSARSGSDAFRALFRDNQLREDAFDREDLRLYRVRVVPLSNSPASR